MRIIAGKHKGRKIELGKGTAHVRPTSGFTREAVFNIISHGRHAIELEGARVADLCCGSGALGLEALSRGAGHVTFVDMDYHTLQNALANARKFGEDTHVKGLSTSVTDLPRAASPYTVVFLDPPYHGNLIAPCLKSLKERGWVDADSLIVVEHDDDEHLTVPPTYTELDQRHYGRAVIRLLRLQTAPVTGSAA